MEMLNIRIAKSYTIYKGIDREIGIDDVIPPKLCKKETEPFLNEYFQYITDTMLSPLNEDTFRRICDYYRSLNLRGVPCEVVAGDDKPLSDVYGNSLLFLGIDVAFKCSESLLESNWDLLPRELLNEYCLCNRMEDIPAVINACRHGGNDWKPCWVYQVLI